MDGRFRLVAALLVMLSLVAGCHSMTGKTAGENIDDATITACPNVCFASKKSLARGPANSNCNPGSAPISMRSGMR